MLPFLTPRHIKESKLVARNARRILRYKRDALDAGELERLEGRVTELETATHTGEKVGIERATGQLEKEFTRVLGASRGGWQENWEVLVVAVVIALGIRAYLLQPFKIPTGSMQPTLNGVIVTPTRERPPNFLVRAIHLVTLGRTYFDLVAPDSSAVVGMEPARRFGFLSGTRVKFASGKSLVLPVEARAAAERLGILYGRSYRRGDPVARGHIDTGDQVFVDKLCYHFFPPKRGEVFVFKTTGIARIESRSDIDPNQGSQHYIKRLAAVGGDEMRIDPPDLHINGARASEPGFARVMERRDGYRGYSNGSDGGGRFPILGDPEMTYTVPSRSYFALGDNSFHSSDSREFGPVPERNLVGRGVFVYWPFNRHWGGIR